MTFPVADENAAGPLQLRQKNAREYAKTGMVVSLGALVVTGFLKNDAARKLHVASGVALIGFSWWHHSLYQKREDRA